MSGFLSKFLRNNKGDQKASVVSRQEPKLTARPRDDLHEINKALHPDEVFIDYEATNNVSVIHEPLHDSEPKSEVQARAHLETVTSEHDHLNEVFEDEIERDSAQYHQDKDHDPFEPPQGFESSWMKYAKENKIIKSISIKNTLDNAGNVFIHYAAAFGKSHLLKRLIEDGWPLEKKNYYGKTPYDFAVHYENIINAYFIENVIKDMRGNFDSQEKCSSTDDDIPNPSIGIADRATQTSIERLPNNIWGILVETSKCPKEFWGYRYDANATDEDGNTLLHYAAKAGNKSYTLHLLELGWGILKKNNKRLTPLDVAQIDGHIDLVDTLKRLYKIFLDEHTESDENATVPSREETPVDDISEAFNESLETEKNDQINDLRLQDSETLQTPTTLACIKCGASFADFNILIRLGFCPFCGEKQPDDEAKIANTESQSEYKGEDKDFFERTSNDYQADSLEEVFIEEVTYASTTKLHSTERVAEENNQTQRSKSVPISFSEEPFSGLDEGFDDEIIDIDLQSYQPKSRGRNSSDENYESLSDWNEAHSENAQTEEWEIFLDEDLEEQSHPSDQYFEDEDPLEQGKIAEYASRLTSRITSYQSKDRRIIYAFFISILGDFPYYQSYAAIERLIAKDVQIDQIRDAYAIKRLWMTNPNIWSSRRKNHMDNSSPVSINPKLKNSMSWQLASDLVNFLTPNELENLIVNDWYAEWLNLPLHGGDSASGLDPAYSLYPTYLYEKRRLLTSNVNTW